MDAEEANPHQRLDAQHESATQRRRMTVAEDGEWGMSKESNKDSKLKTATRPQMLTSESEGQFNSRDWIKEGNHLFASSKATRAVWVVKRRKLKRSLNAIGNWTHGTGMWADLEGLPKASMLLLGYSVEMFLKAGLAKAYQGCSEQMFDRDVRQFSHGFTKLATEVAFDSSERDRMDLGILQKMVLFNARYPIKPRESITTIHQQAERMHQVWSKSEFTRMRQMVLRIRAHVSRIDMDSFNPSSVASIKLGDDGYVTYRTGGHLPPRVTFKYSTAQRQAGEDNVDALRNLARDGQLLLLDHIWEQATFHEDNLPAERQSLAGSSEAS